MAFGVELEPCLPSLYSQADHCAYVFKAVSVSFVNCRLQLMLIELENATLMMTINTILKHW